jgi:peptidoglycan L-alanyl-D-glutamate endopeptidase CwlK
MRTLLPNVQRLARQFLTAKIADGLSLRVISGTRTYAEQDALYQQGRKGNPGPVVTRSRAGQSNHNFGLAWDIGIFDNGRYLADSPLYAQAAAALLPGLEWGGNWVSFQDKPHYQAATGLAIKEVRSQFEAGTLRVGGGS